MKQKAFILPTLLILLASLAVLHSFFIKDYFKIAHLSGLYRNYLTNSIQLNEIISKMTAFNSRCKVLENREYCFISKAKPTNLINLEKLLEKSNRQLTCANNFNSNSTPLNYELSSKSSISTKLCPASFSFSTSTSIKGNYSSLNLSHLDTRNLNILGFFESSLLLEPAKELALIALGDVIVPELVCPNTKFCQLKIASLTGRITILQVTGRFNIYLYSKLLNNLPANFAYSNWNLNELEELNNLPVSISYN